MVSISVVGQGHCKDPKAVYSVFIFMLSWERSGEGREEQGEQIALAGVVQSKQRWGGRELRAKLSCVSFTFPLHTAEQMTEVRSGERRVLIPAEPAALAVPPLSQIHFPLLIQLFHDVQVTGTIRAHPGSDINKCNNTTKRRSRGSRSSKWRWKPHASRRRW